MGRHGKYFDETQLASIDAARRGGQTTRCPVDEKPLVTTVWPSGQHQIVYFVCRACSRIGALTYRVDDPTAPGRPARASRPSSPPPKR